MYCLLCILPQVVIPVAGVLFYYLVLPTPPPSPLSLEPKEEQKRWPTPKPKHRFRGQSERGPAVRGGPAYGFWFSTIISGCGASMRTLEKTLSRIGRALSRPLRGVNTGTNKNLLRTYLVFSFISHTPPCPALAKRDRLYRAKNGIRLPPM